MRWGEPAWLHALWALPVLVLFFWQTARRGDRALERFVSAGLLGRLAPGRSLRRRVMKRILLLLALGVAVVALARPKWGSELVMTEREGIDIVMVLDTSLSMLAEDIRPNRLERAKQEIKGLLEKLRGDRVGIVPFAGSAFVLCPLTLDYGSAAMFLDAVGAGMIPKPGTNVEAAIDKAVEIFDPREKKHKVIILVTDGEEQVGDPARAAERAKEEGVVVHAIGIGSREGEPIPVRDARGDLEGFKKDEKGEIVLSRLNDAVLQQTAYLTGGSYYPATARGLELEAIYEKIAGMEGKEQEGDLVRHYPERFQGFLLLGILLLAGEAMMGDRKRKAERWEGRFE